MQTNLRFGCVIFRHYLDQRNESLYDALLDYAADSFDILEETPAQLGLRSAYWITLSTGH